MVKSLETFNQKMIRRWSQQPSRKQVHLNKSEKVFFSIRRYARYSGLNGCLPKNSAHVLLDEDQFSSEEATITFKIEAIIRCPRLPQLSEKN